MASVLQLPASLVTLYPIAWRDAKDDSCRCRRTRTNNPTAPAAPLDTGSSWALATVRAARGTAGTTHAWWRAPWPLARSVCPGPRTLAV